MWDCNWLCRWCLIHKNPSDRPLLDADADALRFNCISFSAIGRMLATWLNRRRVRYLILILCSPFLIPLFLATCPLICAVEICCFFCRKRRRKVIEGQRRGEEEEEEDGGDRGGLLQRYLEDQLLLVVGSLGGDVMEEDDGVDVRYFDTASPRGQ